MGDIKSSDSWRKEDNTCSHIARSHGRDVEDLGDPRSGLSNRFWNRSRVSTEGRSGHEAREEPGRLRSAYTHSTEGNSWESALEGDLLVARMLNKSECAWRARRVARPHEPDPLVTRRRALPSSTAGARS